MVELMSRSVAFAEGVVTMVCPVLLALALKDDKWKSKMHHPVADPVVMLVIAGAALVTGVCPLLACCISEIFPNACVSWPSLTSSLAALLSSACLLILACWISLLIISERIVFGFGVCFGLFLVIRAVIYSPDAQTPVTTGGGRDRDASEEEAKELRTMLDKSNEFLSGATGVLFLGLEGMVLEYQIRAYGGTEGALRAGITISFILSAFGVALMYLAMNPPCTSARMTFLVYLTDFGMAISTFAILVTVMTELMGPAGLIWLVLPLLLFFCVLLKVHKNDQPRERLGILPSTSDDPGGIAEENQGAAGDNEGEESKAAPLGLTKVTFTGFLAVSVKALSSGSIDRWTAWFLLFAATAVACGVSWRILTHTHKRSIAGAEIADEFATAASFCTHFFVAVATVLFTVMGWEALTAKEHVTIASCARFSQVTCLSHNTVLDALQAKDMCTCIDHLYGN